LLDILERDDDRPGTISGQVHPARARHQGGPVAIEQGGEVGAQRVGPLAVEMGRVDEERVVIFRSQTDAMDSLP
jgi:hypothetical protein